MLLNQPIGFDKDEPSNPYIDGALFQQELFELDRPDDYKRIIININSPGGNVVEGYNICNGILKTKTPVDTCCTGIAASMAATVFMMGRKRIMADYAALMIHNPFGGDDKKMLGAMKNSLIKMVSAKCNVSEEEVEEMMKKETWLSAQEAFDKGFCTDIDITSKANEKRGIRASTVYAMWKAANEIQNNSNTNSNIPNMENNAQAKIDTSLIAAYLNLNPETTSAAVLTEVKARINGLTLAKNKADEELDEMKKKMDKMKSDYEEMKNKYDLKCKEMEDEKEKAKKEHEAKEKEAKDAKDAAVAATAKAEIDKYVTAGRVKADQVDKLVVIAVAQGLDVVKDLLGSLPATKPMPATAQAPVNTTEVSDPNKTGMSAVHLMAKVRADQMNRSK